MKLRRTALMIAMVILVTICVQPIGAAAVTAGSLTNDNQTALVTRPLADSVLSNDKAKIDVTNKDSGNVKVAYTGGSSSRIKVLVIGPKGTKYQYDLNNKGTYETLPLTEGDGSYEIGVYVNTSGTSYSTAYKTTVTAKLKNQYAPFLASNQYVNYTEKSKAVEKAAELTKGLKSDEGLKKIEAIYNFVIKNLTYDKDKAAKVIAGQMTGYLPDVDAVLAAKKGICFDYAALMSAMLRSQGIPCKLVVGYAGDAYHAWINCYIDNVGWVDSIIYFDGKDWKLMDPTFASSSNSSESVMKYIGDGKNYTQKYCY